MSKDDFTLEYPFEELRNKIMEMIPDTAPKCPDCGLEMLSPIVFLNPKDGTLDRYGIECTSIDCNYQELRKW